MIKKCIYLVTLLIGTVSLSGCYFAPGMHMKSDDLTPTLSNNKIVTPKIQPITAQLIMTINKKVAQEKQRASKDFVVPKDFFTNIKSYQYHVGKQDVLNITVWGHPELSGPTNTSIASGSAPLTNSNTNTPTASGFTVDNHGDIYYPYVGYIHVGGKTIDQLQRLTTKKLALFLKDPQVNVQVAQYNSQHVQVYGAVKQVKMLPINNIPLTVREAVTMAGGVNRCGPSTVTSSTGSSQSICADLQNVVLKHGHQKIIINLNTLTAPNGQSENYILQGGDSIYVPDNNHSRVFILGAVMRPGPYNIGSEPMSLREAFGDAAGVTFKSDPTYTYVIRNYHDDPKIFELDARSPDSLNLAGDFMLKPQDIVFISTSKLTDLNSVMNELTPTLSTYAYINSIAR